MSGFFGETLGERRNVAFGEIEFDAFEAVHGEEDDAGAERLSAFNLQQEIVERSEIDSTQAEAISGEMKDGSPEFFARVGEGGNDDGTGAEGVGGLI